MSTSVLVEEEPEVGFRPDLSDVFDRFVGPEELPSVEWLHQVNLQQPRRSIHCLPVQAQQWKRLVDVTAALGMLIVLAPVMVAVAIAVRLTSPGPIIFSQVRVGLNERKTKKDRRSGQSTIDPEQDRRRPDNDRRRDVSYGKHFTLYKFRTMRIDAERFGAQLATKNDPRVTPIGRFLRKSRLDELPQLWNVLKGEMSLVGPRPERPEFIERLSDEVPGYLQRLGLKPGLTGLAQIINGYDTDIESFRRKVSLDLLYLQNCCFRNDLRVLFRTVWVVLTGKGAH